MPDTGTFDLHRTLPLPPERLWTLLTDPSERGSWSAPVPDMTATILSADTRAGGAERIRFEPGPGSGDMHPFDVDYRWYCLSPAKRAVFTETVEMDGEMAGMSFTSLVTFALAGDGGSTDLTVTVALSAFTTGSDISDARLGWEGGLANLDARIATLDQEA